MELRNSKFRKNSTAFVLIMIFGTLLFGSVLTNFINIVSNNWWNRFIEDLFWELGGGSSSVRNLFMDRYTAKISAWVLIKFIGAFALFAYKCYVMWFAIEDYNELCRRENPNVEQQSYNYIIVWLLCTIVPFGIYTMYWLYKQGDQLKEIAERNGIWIKRRGSNYLKMLLIPSIIIVVSWIVLVISFSVSTVGLLNVLTSDNSGAEVGVIIAFILTVVSLIAMIVCVFLRGWIFNHLVWGFFVGDLYRVIEFTEYQGVDRQDNSNNVQRQIEVRELDQPTQAVGSILIRTGQYKDALISVKEGEEIILGREKARCHLIFENPHVSRIHCGVCYSSHDNTYIITDYSTNGTSIKDGKQFLKNQPMKCRRGTIITLGKSGEEFLVR